MTYLENIKKILGIIRPELERQYYVSKLGLFGSVVRDDFAPDTSDVDIIVSFTKPIGIEFVDLSYFLENKLSRKVDVVSMKGLKEKFFKEIEKEIIYV